MRFRAIVLAGFLCLAGMAPALAENGAYSLLDGAIRTDLQFSDALFDRQENVTDKVALVLKARKAGRLETGALYFGGRFVGSAIWETTNTPGKFPILSRLPPTHTTGTTDSYGVVNEISANATVTLPWVTAVVQGEYTEIEYPGQDDIQLRKAWVAVGDLDRFPFYAAIGRKTVHFGQFDTYAPFTHSHSAHYFWAQSDDPVLELGFVGERTELAFTLIPQHRGLRVISSPKNNGEWSNFAINGSHRFDVGPGRSVKVGAGFLRGSIYDSVIAHHPPGVGINRVWNGIWDVNMTYRAARFDLNVEFTRTQDAWPATGHHVQATTVQGRYRSKLLGRPATYSLSASRGVQGTRGTQWERMEQVILGVEVEPAEHVTIGAEYMFNSGFVPLIMPTVTGDRGVQSHTVITGVKLAF